MVKCLAQFEVFEFIFTGVKINLHALNGPWPAFQVSFSHLSQRGYHIRLPSFWLFSF